MTYTRHINVMNQDVTRCPKCRSLVNPLWFLGQWGEKMFIETFEAEHVCGHVWIVQTRDMPVLMVEDG